MQQQSGSDRFHQNHLFDGESDRLFSEEDRSLYMYIYTFTCSLYWKQITESLQRDNEDLELPSLQCGDRIWYRSGNAGKCEIFNLKHIANCFFPYYWKESYIYPELSVMDYEDHSEVRYFQQQCASKKGISMPRRYIHTAQQVFLSCQVLLRTGSANSVERSVVDDFLQHANVAFDTALNTHM